MSNRNYPMGSKNLLRGINAQSHFNKIFKHMIVNYLNFFNFDVIV